jgi:hypothetical protein
MEPDKEAIFQASFGYEASSGGNRVNLGDAKLAYAFSCVVLGLIILSPTLAMAIPFPSGEQFSELWILGPNRMLEGYPFNVSSGESYKVYLGVGNQMGALGYYRVNVEFRNESEPLPNSTVGMPSPLEPVFEYNVFLRNNETWEKELSFSFSGVSFEGDVCRVSKVLIGDYAVDVDKVAVWNATSSAFYYELFFELWLYNATVSGFQFHNRWVGLWLNMSRQP